MDDREREMAFTHIFKRDGSVVGFDFSKITEAVFQAARSIGGEDYATAEKLSHLIIERLSRKFTRDAPPTVEEIQDAVEKTLIEEGRAKTAKAYILYREQHREIRDTKATFLAVEKTVDDYLNKSDWRVNENSNMDFSFSGLMLHTAGSLIAHYTLNKIYPKSISDAHRNGSLHIHDLSHGITGYCAGWSLQKLILDGLGGVAHKVAAAPAKHLDVLVIQMVNFLGVMQMEWAGAQAFSSADTLLAPFVRSDNLNYKQVKQNLQRLVFSLNIPSRWGSQAPFTNLTFDLIPPEDLAKQPAIVGGKILDTTYGDYQEEMDMINKAFIEIMMEGDAQGRVLTFPIPTYSLVKGFNWESEVAGKLFELTSKYGLPYFQNYIGTGMNPSSIRAMCCRLNLDLEELSNKMGHIFSAGDNTGSIGVVTLNMNRIGYEAKGEKADFFRQLNYYMDLAKTSLEIKRKVVENNLKNGLMPYTSVYLGKFSHHFSTIALTGMNEACLNFFGKDIASDEGRAFAIETLQYMRDRIQMYQKESGNLYNLEASPAESASFRFAKADRKLYGKEVITAGTEEAPYLTNSTWLPVGATDDPIEAVMHQGDIQALYNGGTILHLFLGERLPDGESCKNLVRKIAENSRLPYFSVTPTFSVCPVHGYVSGEHYTCPHHVE
ncbi:MAG: ribonucleoside triphosphate reductase [Candidatus Theseobacter exili]|nr:ribonucleoside triphosphate reductase [Candidatus Theseobacter exili]